MLKSPLSALLCSSPTPTLITQTPLNKHLLEALIFQTFLLKSLNPLTATFTANSLKPFLSQAYFYNCDATLHPPGTLPPTPTFPSACLRASLYLHYTPDRGLTKRVNPAQELYIVFILS